MFDSVEIPFEDGEIYCEISNYKTLTSESNVIFVLPGGPGLGMKQYNEVDPILKLQQAENHLIFLDPPGTGKSRKFKADSCNMQQYIRCVEHIRQSLNLNKITLLGISYGSMVAVGYSIQYSKNLEKVILATGAPSYHFLEQAKQNLLKSGSEEQNEVCRKWLWEGKFPSSEEVAYFLWVMGPLYSNTAKAAENSGGSSAISDKLKNYDFPVELYNHALSSKFWCFDYTKDLKKISCPVLILSGKDDWINDPRFAEIMHREIKGSTLHILDSRHLIYVDRPEEFYNLISAFLYKGKDPLNAISSSSSISSSSVVAAQKIGFLGTPPVSKKSEEQFGEKEKPSFHNTM